MPKRPASAFPTIGTETIGRAGCRAVDVAHYRQGLRNMLAWLGICPGLGTALT